MYTSHGSQLVCRAKGQGIQVTEIPSFVSDEPFSFICNAQDLERGWTPTNLFSLRGVTSFGGLQFVRILVNTENFDHTLELIEEWAEAGIPTKLDFPTFQRRPKVGTKVDPTFNGLDVEACYSLQGRVWHTSKQLKVKIKSLFAGDPLVTIGD